MPISAVRALGIALLLAAPSAASANSRIYEGTEAQALKCAAYFSSTTYMLESRGLMTPRNREEGAVAATNIIGQHVGGTYQQKLKAFQAVLNRLPASETALVSDTLKHLNWCSENFLR